MIPLTILQELLVRFVLNLSDEELKNTNRVLYHFQQAYWFYRDFYDSQDLCFFDFVVSLGRLVGWDVKFCRRAFKAFKKYEKAVPRCGVLLLDQETHSQVLLVQSYWGNYWNCPSGKMNFGETKKQCALRETLEEIGFQPSVVSDQSYRVAQGPFSCYFFIGEASLSFPFKTQTREEIAAIEWRSLEEVKKLVPAIYPVAQTAIHLWEKGKKT